MSVAEGEPGNYECDHGAWGGEKDHKGTFRGSSLNRLGEWSRFWQAVLTLLQGGVKAWRAQGRGPPKIEVRDQDLGLTFQTVCIRGNRKLGYILTNI